ncbi:unnamed protein product [Plutella xylostella]|uniref:(diamondback moth) hypothetical protein n=1 Tax=Plutella xylostella TaxID=51655 RepID=A0A8S4DXN8_PLUXY|nr:unnamed protein product [Plutella xylostella]
MPKRATKVTKTINSKKKLTHTDNKLLVVDKTESPEVDSKQHLKKLINQSYKDGVDAQSAKPNDRKDKRKRLENLQTVLLCSNASLIQGKDNGGYRCSLCPHKFPESSELKTHFLNRHRNVDFIMRLQAGMFERSTKLDVTFLRCSLCNAELDKLDDLKAHLQMEHGKVIHNDVTNYMVPFKFEKPGFHCVECAAEFGEFKPLFEHMHHHYRNYVCDQCDAGFVTKNARNSHQARHGYGTYSCLQCDKTFPSAQHLSSHVTRVHDKVKMSRCHLCLEKFTDIFKKAQHTEEVHGIVQPKAVCSACSREFKNHRSLKIHVKRDHLMERRHKCEFCEKAFYTGSQLKHHAIKHIDAPKSFKCSMCPKAYDRRKTLMNHMRSHTELLQFHCQMCDKEFMSQVGVDYHVKMKHSATSS